MKFHDFFIDHLKDKLDEYVRRFPVPVRVLRVPQRGGLIRARLKGLSISFLFMLSGGPPLILVPLVFRCQSCFS